MSKKNNIHLEVSSLLQKTIVSDFKQSVEVHPILLMQSLKSLIGIDLESNYSEILNWANNYISTGFYSLYKALVSNKLILKKQRGKVIRVYPRQESDSKINWNDTAENIEKLIRASSLPFSGAYFFLNKKKYRIFKAKIFHTSFA